MNRRNFIRNLTGVGIFSILPGAGRIWRAERPEISAFPFWEMGTNGFAYTFCELDGTPLKEPLQKIMQDIHRLQRRRQLEQYRILGEIALDVRGRTGQWPTSMEISPL